MFPSWGKSGFAQSLRESLEGRVARATPEKAPEAKMARGLVLG